DWTGEAKDAAQQRKNNLTEGSGDLSQALTTASENIGAVVDEFIQQAVVQFCRGVIELGGNGSIGGMTTSEVSDMIDTVDELPEAIEKIQAKIDEINSRSWFEDAVNYVGDFFKGFASVFISVQTLGLVSLPDTVDEDDLPGIKQKLQGALREAKQKLQGFCRDYRNRAMSVHKYARTYVQRIQQYYSQLIQSMNKLLDPAPFEESDESNGESGEDSGKGVNKASMPGGPGVGSSPGS